MLRWIDGVVIERDIDFDGSPSVRVEVRKVNDCFIASLHQMITTWCQDPKERARDASLVLRFRSLAASSSGKPSLDVPNDADSTELSTAPNCFTFEVFPVFCNIFRTARSSSASPRRPNVRRTTPTRATIGAHQTNPSCPLMFMPKIPVTSVSGT